MSERIEWLPDGTPWSPRFGDRYHSQHDGGLAQAEGVFLRGCGLPQAWAGREAFSILETGFGLGFNFLVSWAAWRADPARCTRLRFVSVEAHPASAEDIVRNVAAHPSLLPLAQELAAAWRGVGTAGRLELALDDGRVLLGLRIGDARPMLGEAADEGLVADAVFLDGFSPALNPGIWSHETLAQVARCCRTGTRLATWTVARPVRQSLESCGFQVHRVAGVPPKRQNLWAVFASSVDPSALSPHP